jgi:hypothetical protein
MRSDSRFYLPFAYIVELSAGEQDLVTIRDVRVKIFKRTAMAATTNVACGHGGDGVYEGASITVDTAKSTTTVQQLDSVEVAPMPPASLSVSRGKFVEADISVKPIPGFLYEGQLEVHGIINGEERVFAEGTIDEPIRWAGDPPGEPNGFMDWNFTKKGLSHYADDEDYYSQLPPS